MKLRRTIGALVLVLTILISGTTAWGATITGAKAAVTPITLAENGTQMMESSVVSRPLSMHKPEAIEKIVSPGGKAGWQVKNGHYQLKDANGNLVKGRALVSDTFSSSGIGNVSFYYFDASGNMQLGWQWIQVTGGKWCLYYFNEEEGPLLGAGYMGGVKDDRTLDEYGRVTVNGVVAAFDTKPN